MRRLFTILLLLFPLSLSAQHISFKGITVNGNYKRFASKLVRQGYKDISHTKDYSRLSGEFAGMHNCTLWVKSTPKTKTVYSVMVTTPSNYVTWSGIKSKFQELTEALSEKYTLVETDTTFQYPYSDGGGKELEAIRLGKGSYSAKYKAKGGYIRIWISVSFSYERNWGEIDIVYEDSINCELLQTEKNNQIISDL